MSYRSEGLQKILEEIILKKKKIQEQLEKKAVKTRIGMASSRTSNYRLIPLLGFCKYY